LRPSRLALQELDIAVMGLRVNIADQTIYAGSFRLHDDCLNMIADLWHCPRPASFAEYGCYAGAGTVGSTEACLLAGLALKFRWRAWYAKAHGLDERAVRAVYPNLVISTVFQAAWEKLFRYMDIEPRFVRPSVNSFALEPATVAAACDECTIGVVAILGNHCACVRRQLHERIRDARPATEAAIDLRARASPLLCNAWRAQTAANTTQCCQSARRSRH
jgi:glutamate decarboxylase